MSYNGSGTFVINTAGQPVVANTVISATVFNALTADLATGLSTAITKDGQTTITANIPFGSNKITGLGAGTAATDAANLSQVQSTAAKLVTVTGTDTLTGTMSPALGAYAAGQLFYFIAGAANTGAMTINIDGLGAKSITRDGSTALIANDVLSGEIVVICYDGTRFQMINAANSFGNTTINGTLTVTGNAGFQANVSITSALSVGGVFAVTGASTLTGTATLTANPVLSAGTANGVLYLNGSKVATSGSALVFDASNVRLGIGTASPAAPVHVSKSVVSGEVNFLTENTVSSQYGSANFAAKNDTGVTAFFGIQNSARLTYGVMTASSAGLYTANAAGLYLLVDAAGSIRFATNGGTECARIASDGKVGIGTTSPASTLQVGTKTSSTVSDVSTIFSAGGASASGGKLYAATFCNTVAGANNNEVLISFTPASNASATGAIGTIFTNSSNGESAMKFYTYGASDGLAERARIDSSGNFLIGTTSATFKFTLQGSGSGTGVQDGLVAIRCTTAANPVGIAFVNSGNAASSFNDLAFIQAIIESGSAKGALRFITRNSDGSNSDVAERARITSGGDLLVGATSATNTASTGARLYANGAIATTRSESTDSTGNLTVYSTGAAASRFYVGMGGTVYATNTTISAISDQRFKENIQDLDVGLDAILALKPRKFDWKEGKGKDKKDDRGFIAQEFEQVFPDLIDEWKDPAPEGEEPYKSVRQDLIPVLVKAIQEQQAMINELKAKVAALESK